MLAVPKFRNPLQSRSRHLSKNDRLSRLFIQRLMDAAERGVRVRVIIDDSMTESDPHYLAKFASHSIGTDRTLGESGRSAVKRRCHLSPSITFSMTEIGQLLQWGTVVSRRASFPNPYCGLLNQRIPSEISRDRVYFPH